MRGCSICGFRTGQRPYQARQLLTIGQDLSLIKAVHLFRNCQTDKLIQRKPIAMRKGIGSFEDRWR
jgi:hypothetical protein